MSVLLGRKSSYRRSVEGALAEMVRLAGTLCVCLWEYAARWFDDRAQSPEGSPSTTLVSLWQLPFRYDSNGLHCVWMSQRMCAA